MVSMSDIKVVKRNGDVVRFDADKIKKAVVKAFVAAHGDTAKSSQRVDGLALSIAEDVSNSVLSRSTDRTAWHIEEIQDYVELSIMRSGELDVAKLYILYRNDKNAQREAYADAFDIMVKSVDGRLEALDKSRLFKVIDESCRGLGRHVSKSDILSGLSKVVYDRMSHDELLSAPVMVSRALIERDPDYSVVTARLFMHKIREEVMTRTLTHKEMTREYPSYFKSYIESGVRRGFLDSRLLNFDLDLLGENIVADRDMSFQYLGLQILYDRYLIHDDGVRLEMPQALWMRVAMGVALAEEDFNSKAIEFYNVLSSFSFVSSTPTLFNSGTVRPQLSSCFLTHVEDNLDAIYQSIKENALLSKYAGGLGNDWTPVRSLGAHIKGTNGKSQGVVPFLKVVNDTAVAVNQGGKRKGAVCAYLETWHMDIEEFLELRKNTGDDRRRTHDMDTANWVPDLFMERVVNNAEWTLFSPSDVPDLHDLYGARFKTAYEAYESSADKGNIKVFKRVKAVELWRKMLSMLFETGHPWITFKDPCNVRSPQQHDGVVHSSNLCTEIMLNTSADEIAVCNLGSINLAAFMDADDLSSVNYEDKSSIASLIRLDDLKRTVRTAMRMLDDVLDVNFYSVDKARTSNQRHRPVGLGIMGVYDALIMARIPYGSKAAEEFSDVVHEHISYYAIEASHDMSIERGSYETFDGSLWSRGLVPIDSLSMLDAERGCEIEVDRDYTLDWDALRSKVRTGMRNSNCLALAPTATISNIVGVGQGIEPIYQNLYVKSNLSGEFTVVNKYLVRDLKRIGIWDESMVKDIKYYDGSIQRITRIPQTLKDLYKTAFEIDPRWLINCAAKRQKWVDQGISLNLYLSTPSGRILDETYKYAWRKGLKTTYYLRSLGASSAEKSTVDKSSLNAVDAGVVQPKMCAIDDPTCEACQ